MRVVNDRVDFAKVTKTVGDLLDAAQPFQGRFADIVSGDVENNGGQPGIFGLRRAGAGRRQDQYGRQQEKQDFHGSPPQVGIAPYIVSNGGRLPESPAGKTHTPSYPIDV